MVVERQRQAGREPEVGDAEAGNGQPSLPLGAEADRDAGSCHTWYYRPRRAKVHARQVPDPPRAYKTAGPALTDGGSPHQEGQHMRTTRRAGFAMSLAALLTIVMAAPAGEAGTTHPNDGGHDLLARW